MDPLPHIDKVLNNCIHCGMCLPVCPTYALTNLEQSSPRGRIRLMREMYTGKLELGPTFVDEMYFCLDCQACQTACPAGVQYGELVEDARSIIADRGADPFAVRWMRILFLKGVLASVGRTKFLARVLRWFRRSGLAEAAEASGLMNLLPSSVRFRLGLLPPVSDHFFDDEAPGRIPSKGKMRGQVGLLTGCMMNVSFAEVHHDVAEVLSRNGFDVVIPKSQGCCGSLLAHYGGTADARDLARGIIDLFDPLNLDAIVVDSAGCSAFMKEYGRILADDAKYAAKADRFSKKTKEFTEFMSEAGFEAPSERLDKRVTYHDACHLVHTQKISRPPRDIIRSIPGASFCELTESTWCCGSAGVYNVVRSGDSMKLLERKMEHIRATGAEIVVTGNPGCHLQIQYGIAMSGMHAEVMHPASLLRKAYEQKEAGPDDGVN